MGSFDKLRIPYEASEYGRFQYVGRFDGDKQFMAFVTGAMPGEEPYPPLESNAYEKKRWLAVIHIFDEDGRHLRSESRLGGLDRDGRDAACERAWSELGGLFTELGIASAEPADIYIREFRVNLDDVIHELVYEEEDEENEEAEQDEEETERGWVMLWPNDIMFHPPWDSGDYST